MAHRRRGFTRVELLIAGAIAAILAGLLIPAVQKLRAASDRTRCGNNLRALGAGIHSFHEAKHRLPPGGSHTPPACSACLEPECRKREWSWAYHILPHIGQADAYRNPDVAAVQTAAVPLFYCSARRSPRRWNERTMLDYAGNAGTEENGTNGAIQRSIEPPIGFVDFSDGLSSTLLLSEKRLNVAEFGSAPGDSLGFATPGWTAACEAHRYGLLPPAPDTAAPGDRMPFSEFGSSHRGVFNAMFADGSLRTIRFTVNPAVWRRACIRNDNQNFSINEL